MSRAVLVGLRNQMWRDGTYKDGFVGFPEAGQEQEALPTLRLTGPDGFVLAVQIENENEPVYRDNLAVKILDPVLARAVRAKELEYF